MTKRPSALKMRRINAVRVFVQFTIISKGWTKNMTLDDGIGAPVFQLFFLSTVNSIIEMGLLITDKNESNILAIIGLFNRGF